eukprot:10268365-Lingulodinium_polyedra.AAC.1
MDSHGLEGWQCQSWQAAAAVQAALRGTDRPADAAWGCEGPTDQQMHVASSSSLRAISHSSYPSFHRPGPGRPGSPRPQVHCHPGALAG